MKCIHGWATTCFTDDADWTCRAIAAWLYANDPHTERPVRADA